MKYPQKLIKAKILKRYKRFLSDIELDSGEIICAHVPNTGSMKTCWAENWPVYLTKNDDPKRKLKYTLEMTDNGKSLICVNTNLTNKLVKEAIENEWISEVTGYKNIKPEKTIFDSRIDFFLSESEENKNDMYIEVKNVTLDGEDGLALFPDSVTTRGQKHLQDLIKIKESGLRAGMLYVINREDVDRFSPAENIDPKYTELLRLAHKSGVEIMAYQCSLSPDEVKLTKKMKVIL